MTIENTYAIIAVLGAIVVFYAFHNQHADWILDLVILCAALATPRQQYTIAAVLVAAIVRHSRLALALAGNLPAPALALLLPGAAHMLRSAAPEAAPEAAPGAALSEENSNDEMVEIPQSVAEKHAELICFGETLALARLVAADKIGLTEAVKIGAGAKSGSKYQRRSAQIKTAIEDLQDHYRPLDESKKTVL